LSRRAEVVVAIVLQVVVRADISPAQQTILLVRVFL
jgi:hypothetical protein